MNADDYSNYTFNVIAIFLIKFYKNIVMQAIISYGGKIEKK